MVWDYPEIPAFSESFGSPMALLKVITDFIERESSVLNTHTSIVKHGDGAQLLLEETTVERYGGFDSMG